MLFLVLWLKIQFWRALELVKFLQYLLQFSVGKVLGEKLKHIPKASKEKLHKSTQVSTNHEFIIKQ